VSDKEKAAWDMSPDAHVELAMRNYEAQEELFVHLKQAFDASGISYELVADRLGVPVAHAEDCLLGEINLSLSEIRLLANSIGVLITYQIKEVPSE
jgi:hypothetical protein